MAFVYIPGFPAKIFVPDAEPDKQKKHPCADCFSCQWCSDERCSQCLRRKNHLNEQSKHEILADSKTNASEK